MQYRLLGKTGWNVSTISFGAWAIGGDAWGNVDDKVSLSALHTALDNGINFFDTADVYGDGRSERILKKLRKESSKEFYIATKAGRRLNPHTAAGYNKKNLTRFVNRSLKNLAMDSLDLVQLHCPPQDVYYMPEVFGVLDDLVKDGKIKHYGVSVERVEEALKAIEYDNVQSIQIIFNIFRQRPSELFFKEAKKKKVGIIARLPLSSGMLTGKFSMKTKFAKNDHRNFNRQGKAFDKGETFSGVDYKKSLSAVNLLDEARPKNMNLSVFALKWILMHPEVSCVIPGMKNKIQITDNVSVFKYPKLSKAAMKNVKGIYDEHIKESVHHLW